MSITIISQEEIHNLYYKDNDKCVNELIKNIENGSNNISLETLFGIIIDFDDLLKIIKVVVNIYDINSDYLNNVLFHFCSIHCRERCFCGNTEKNGKHFPIKYDSHFAIVKLLTHITKEKKIIKRSLYRSCCSANNAKLLLNIVENLYNKFGYIGIGWLHDDDVFGEYSPLPKNLQNLQFMLNNYIY